MKPIEAGCLAIVIAGTHTGKNVRCVSCHRAGDEISAPDGNRYKFNPNDRSKDGRPCWVVIGNLSAVRDDGEPLKTGKGWGILPEDALLRIDSEGDDELIEEFAMEECAFQMEQQMKKEGVKRLW